MNRKPRKPRKSLTQTIEEELAMPVVVTINGTRHRTTAFGAIILQLFQKSLRGNRRARKMMLRYHDFARSLSRDPTTFEVILVSKETGKELD